MFNIDSRKATRPIRRSAFAVRLALAGMFWSATALGQTTTVAGPLVSEAAADAEATRLFEAGLVASYKQQWEQAQTLFEAALKIRFVPQYVANLGRMELFLGRPKQAAEHLELFLREDKSAELVWRKDVEKLLVEARSKVAQVTISVDAAGAEVFVDGVAVPGASLAQPIAENPGVHTFEARKTGFVTANESRSLPMGSNEVVALHLLPLAGTSGPLNGDMRQNEKLPLPQKGPTWLPWALVGSGVVFVAGVGTGVGLTVAANRKSDEWDAENAFIHHWTPPDSNVCDPSKMPFNASLCATLESIKQEQERRRVGAGVGFAFGGLGALGVIGSLVLTKHSSKTPGIGSLTPMLGQKLGGFILSGSF